MAQGFGVLAEIDGEAAGTLIVLQEAERAWITRVSVRRAHQRHGIASAMVEVALDLLAERGVPTADLIARARELAAECVARDPDLTTPGFADAIRATEMLASPDWLERN